MSPNHGLLAYSVDTTGAEVYTLQFLNLSTRQLYPESIPNTGSSLAWGNDSQTVFYTTMDEAHRPDKLFRHTLGGAIDSDVLIHHETDDSFYLGVGKTRSEAYVLMSMGSKITSEIHYLDGNNPTGDFQVIRPRTTGIEYDVEHHTDAFYITTNEGAINFKLMKAPVGAVSDWQEVLPHREDVLLEGVSAFVDHLIIYERQGGLPKIRIRQLSTAEEHYIAFPEPTYEVGESTNPDFNTDTLRYGYTSLVTPSSAFDYNLNTREQILLKQTPVLGGYDPTQYVSERLEAIAPDGTPVPLSLVYKKGVALNGQTQYT